LFVRIIATISGPYLSSSRALIFTMPADTILQLAATGLTIALAVIAIYYTLRLHRTQRDFLVLLKRMESDSQALQRIAIQIETGVAAVNEGFRTAMAGAVERQSVAMDSLRDYLDSQEQKLNSLIESFAETVRTAPRPRETALEEHHPSTNLSRLRRESLRDNP